MSKIRSEKTKKAFIKYMEEHPDERFWQSIANFAKVNFVLVSDRFEIDEGIVPRFVNPVDTFNWEGLHGDEVDDE